MFAEVETCSIEKVVLKDEQIYDQQRQISDRQNKIQVTERIKFGSFVGEHCEANLRWIKARAKRLHLIS